MNIIKTSIEDVSDLFQIFMDTLEGRHYIIAVCAKTFSYTGDTFFTLENLKSLFEEESEKIDGIILKKGEEVFYESITNAMSHYSNDGKVTVLKDKNKIQQRITCFFDVFFKIFPYKSFTLYSHETKRGSYFSFGSMWFFAYIFLAEGNGLVLIAGASD